jgi:hypothetical protein
MQRVERAQRMLDQTLDEIRRNDGLIVDQRLDLQEAAPDIAVESPDCIALIIRRDVARTLPTRAASGSRPPSGG